MTFLVLALVHVVAELGENSLDFGRVEIIFALEEIELSCARAVVSIVIAVDDSPDAPYVTAVTHQGETRYGRQSSGGVLSGRDPAVLPSCLE